eukprot:m.18207 g.18207  ORF g.18207 m.18207 type:complete len:146 (-) comp5666_c1_seq1:102-539(-)
MAGRLIAQIVVTGAQVVGKAFAQAYKQAAADAARGGAGAARNAGAAGANGAKKAASGAVRSSLELDEAQKILDVAPDASWDTILQRYEKMYDNLDKNKGGTLYLQSKVYRAKERLEQELRAKGEFPEPSAQPKASTEQPPPPSDK